MNILDLKGENALITGAGQGVGRQVALHFAAHNAGIVYVNDFSAERANAVVDEIKAQGGRAEAVSCDVSDFHAMQAEARAVERATARQQRRQRRCRSVEGRTRGVLGTSAGTMDAVARREPARRIECVAARACRK